MRKRMKGQVFLVIALALFVTGCGGSPTAPAKTADRAVAISVPTPSPQPVPSPAPAPSPIPTPGPEAKVTTWQGRGGYVLDSVAPSTAELMMAVPSHGPLTLELTFDDTRAWGTVKTGSSGAYNGEAHGYVRNGVPRLDVQAALVGPGCPDGLTIDIDLNVATGHAEVTFRLHGGLVSGSAELAREQ